MGKKLLLAGVIAACLPALALASGASAQSYDANCRRENQNSTAEGAIVGGIAGALLGSAVAGRHRSGEGAVVGGVGGAVIGAEIAKSGEHRCPPGYRYYAPPPPPPPPPREFWYGAPEGIRERIDFLQQRINHANEDGWLSPRETRRLNRDLDSVRHQEGDLRYRDGGYLSPPDRDFILHRLDELSHRLHWAERDDN